MSSFFPWCVHDTHYSVCNQSRQTIVKTTQYLFTSGAEWFYSLLYLQFYNDQTKKLETKKYPKVIRKIIAGSFLYSHIIISTSVFDIIIIGKNNLHILSGRNVCWTIHGLMCPWQEPEIMVQKLVITISKLRQKTLNLQLVLRTF